MNIKQELTFGIVGTLIIFLLIGFFVYQYNSRKIRPVSKTSQNTVKAKLTLEEIAKHNSLSDCWLLIAGKVYAVSSCLVNHPGGPDLVAPWCGKETTEVFVTKAGRGSHSDFANGLLKDYYIGPLRR